MKKILLTLALISAIFLTACGNTLPASAALNGEDYVLDVSYTPIYDNMEFIESSGSGEPQTYEDLKEYIPAYGAVSFVGYEIVSQYAPEEAVVITGDKGFLSGPTLYKAHIYYDYLHDVPLDLTVDIAKAGNPENQFENNPPYVVGQKLISALSGFSRTRCLAIPELVFYVYDVNGVDLAYHVDNGEIMFTDKKLLNLNMDLATEERSLITSTANNPVIFTQKSTVADLAQFFQQDWSESGYELFDFKNADEIQCISKDGE